MYKKKLGVEVGCCTRSMSRKGDGKSGDSINSSKSSSIQSKEISPESNSNDSTENIVEKIRFSTPTSRKKSVSYSANKTGSNCATNSPGPLTRGKRKSLSVRNISDYFEKEQPKHCDEINKTTDKKVDVHKSGNDKKTAGLSDDNKHVTNRSDLTNKTLSCKAISVVLRRASEKMLAEYNNLEDNKDDSKKLTNKDKNLTHNTSKESLENMADNITRSNDNNDLKSENSSNKDISENHDPISSLKKKNSPNNSINSKDLKPFSNNDNNLPEKKEKSNEKVVGFEMKKTDENIDNFKEKSSSFSPKQLDDEKSKINEQIESSIKKTDIEKPTTPIKSQSVKKKLQSPEKPSPATCTGETSIKTVKQCPVGPRVEKAEILNEVIKIEHLTRDPVGNEKEVHDSKGKFCDDSDDIISPQEFLKDVFNKTESNLLGNKKTALPDSDKNKNRLSAGKEKKRDESKVVENVEETTKSKSSSINIESEEYDTKNKTENAVVVIENEKPITNSESETNIFEDKTGKLEKKSLVMKPEITDKEKEKQLQKNQESGAEKKVDDTVPNEGSSPRTHAETQALTKNKGKSIEATVSESVVSQNKPTSKSNANTSVNSQQLVVKSITTDNVPKTKRFSSPGKDVAAVESSPQKKQLEELKETGETMIEADSISVSDKKNPKTPRKQSTAGHTNESSSVGENKVVSDISANDLESYERISENESERVKSESSRRSPNTSIRIIDLQEDSRMSGVEEIPEVVIREQSVDNKGKDFSTESNCEIVSTGAGGNVHSEVIDVFDDDDIPINVNKSRTSGKRSFDDENDIAGNEEQSLISSSKKKKVKCSDKEDDEKNTSGEDNEVESLKIGDENSVSGRVKNAEGETKSEQDNDIGGSLDIDDKDVPPTKASFVKPGEEGGEEIVDNDVVDVESSEFDDKTIDSRKDEDEPEKDEVEKDGESKGAEDENIALGKAFIDAEAKEGDGISECSDSECKDIGSQKNFLDEAERENIEKVIDESSDSDSSNIVSVNVFLDDEADEGEEEIVDEVMDEESDESDGSEIVSGNNFLEDEGKEDEDDESDSFDDREILSGKDFLDEEAEEGNEEIGDDTDDDDDDDIISGKYFLEDESDEDEEKNDSEEITEEYSKTNVKNNFSEVNILKGKARETKEEVKIEKKKVKNLAENGNGNEEVLSDNSGEMISFDKSEKSERTTVLKAKMSRSDGTKSTSHPNDKGSWIVSNIKESSKIKTFNNKICTNNVKFVATGIVSNKISFGETNLSLNNNLNWIISTVKEDEGISDSKKKPKKLNQLKRRLESVTKKESSSVSSSILLPSTKDDELVVQENPDLYDSLLLKRKHSKKKLKDNKVKEDNIEELQKCFGSSATVKGTKSLSIPSTSGKTKESIKNTLALKHSKEEDNAPKVLNLDEGMRISKKRFTDAIEIYKKKLKVTHNSDKMDKNSLINTNETPVGAEIKKYPFRITVGNVPKSVSPNELKSIFSQIGCNDITTVSPIMDSVKMKYAVVTFSSRNSQQRALENYGQLFLKGNPLFPLQCHQDDHVVSEERDTHKSNQNPTPEPQKYGKAKTKYNKVSKNDIHSIDKSKLATDMSGVSQNRNLEQSTNHLSKQKSKQKSVIAKNSKSNMNKTYDDNELSQKQTKLKSDVVHLRKSEENAAAARKISGNTDLTTKMGGSQCNSVNIKCLGHVRPTIKEVKEAFSVIGVTDVNCINQMSKKITSVEVASKESVVKLLSYSGKMVINGMPVLIKKKNPLQSSLDLPSTSSANLENKIVKKLKHQHNVKTVINKEQNSDTAAQNRPKDFSLIIKNLPTNSTNKNVRKSLLILGIKGVAKVIIKRDENVNKDKLTGVVKFRNKQVYLNALNTKNILLNGSQVKFIKKKDKKD